MNLVQKFRKFFFALPKNEQKAMWDIMSAIRSEDGGNDNLKSYTTSRIRGSLLGKSATTIYGAIVFASLRKANNYQVAQGYELSEERQKELLVKTNFHWRAHLKCAIRALKKYGFKGKVKDLEKFSDWY